MGRFGVALRDRTDPLMNRSPGTILFALAVLVLTLTVQPVYERPMDGLSVAWFIALAATSAGASVMTASALARAFRRRELRSTFDQFYGVLFLALPLSVGFFLAAISTLGWYFFGWE